MPKPWEKYAKPQLVGDKANIWLQSGPWSRYVRPRPVVAAPTPAVPAAPGLIQSNEPSGNDVERETTPSGAMMSRGESVVDQANREAADAGQFNVGTIGQTAGRALSIGAGAVLGIGGGLAAGGLIGANNARAKAQNEDAFDRAMTGFANQPSTDQVADAYSQGGPSIGVYGVDPNPPGSVAARDPDGTDAGAGGLSVGYSGGDTGGPSGATGGDVTSSGVSADVASSGTGTGSGIEGDRDGSDGVGNGGCFITSAAMSATEEPDDGPDMTTLRQFRDGYMMQKPETAKLVKEYETLAPQVVKGIDSRPDARQVYQQMHQNYIAPAVQQIRNKNPDGALKIYAEMIKFASPLAQQAAKTPEQAGAVQAIGKEAGLISSVLR